MLLEAPYPNRRFYVSEVTGAQRFSVSSISFRGGIVKPVSPAPALGRHILSHTAEEPKEMLTYVRCLVIRGIAKEAADTGAMAILLNTEGEEPWVRRPVMEKTLKLLDWGQEMPFDESLLRKCDYCRSTAEGRMA